MQIFEQNGGFKVTDVYILEGVSPEHTGHLKHTGQSEPKCAILNF